MAQSYAYSNQDVRVTNEPVNNSTTNAISHNCPRHWYKAYNRCKSYHMQHARLTLQCTYVPYNLSSACTTPPPVQREEKSPTPPHFAIVQIETLQSKVARLEKELKDNKEEIQMYQQTCKEIYDVTTKFSKYIIETTITTKYKTYTEHWKPRTTMNLFMKQYKRLKN